MGILRGTYLSYIKAEKICFTYNPGKPFINCLDIELKTGQFCSIMGPNGSGKTTIGKLLVGILKPSSGNIFIDGNDISKMSLGHIGSKVGYLFQNPALQIFAATVFEELSFIMTLKDYDKDYIESEVDRVLALLHMEDKKFSSTFSLSYGQKQRLALAGILLNKPHYLILDEPTTGLDILRKQVLAAVLKELMNMGAGITVFTHDYEFIKNFGGRILKMDRGVIIEDRIE